MGINDSEVELRYSAPFSLSGGVDPSSPQQSLGLFISTTSFPAGVSHLFGDVSADENASRRTAYRCFFIANKNPDTMLTGVRAWIAVSPHDSRVGLGLDPIKSQPILYPIPQASRTNSQFHAPPNITFSQPTDQGSSIYVGNIGPGECRGLWVSRTSLMTKASKGVTASIIIASE